MRPASRNGSAYFGKNNITGNRGLGFRHSRRGGRDYLLLYRFPRDSGTLSVYPARWGSLRRTPFYSAGD